MIFSTIEIIEALNNQIVEQMIVDDNATYTSVVFDSRKAQNDSIFIGILGEESNGAKYVNDAYLNGAKLIIVNDTDRSIIKNQNLNNSEINILFVKDSLVAFGQLGKLARNKFNGTVIGVIGSVGKTTTKNLLREIGGSQPNVYASRGSFNNQTGVPLTLCEVNEECKRLIIELGESHFGDLEYITEISMPHHLVITNVALAHTQFLIDEDGVAKTFIESIERIPENGYIVMPYDIDKKDALVRASKSKIVFVIDETKNYTYDQNNDYAYIKSINTNSDLTNDITIKFRDQEINVHLPLVGRHFVENAALAITMSLLCGDSITEIEKNIKNIEAQGHRMRIVNNEDMVIIDDAYNANPESMKACIEATAEMAKNSNKRSIFIMGPMRELGDLSDAHHISMAEHAMKKNIDIFICVGDATKAAFTANSHKNIFYFDNVEKAIDELKSIVGPNYVIGVKASRGPDASMPALVPIVNFLSELKWEKEKSRN